MAISWNTGTAVDGGNTLVSSLAVTIPAGVNAGDVIVVAFTSFRTTSTAETMQAVSTGTAPTIIGSSVETPVSGTSVVIAGIFYIVAGPSDAGKVITGSLVSGDTGKWAAALGVWSGVSNSAPIDVQGSASAAGASASVTCPTRVTNVANDWQLQIVCMAVGGATYTGGGALTQRESVVDAGSGAGAAIFDSNGSVGPAGTTIGGTVFSNSGHTNWFAGFTVGLAPAAVAGGAPAVVVPPGLISPAVLAQPFYPRPSTPPTAIQQPAPAPQPVPPGLLSPMSLGVPTRPATQAPPQPPQGTSAPQPVPPGLLSPMSLAVPAVFSIPPAPQQQPAPSPELIPPGLLSPMSLGVPTRPATQAPPVPPVITIPSPPPLLTPPGLQSPMVLAEPLYPSQPAPPQQTPAPSPQLIPPGLQSPMSLTVPATPATQAPPQPPEGTPAPQPVPPGLLSPMSLAVPARFSIPPAPQQQPAPSPQFIPPGLLSPMSLGVPTHPATQAPPPPTVLAQPGFYALTPPGRLSPMSIGLGLYAPSPGPGVPPIVPVVAVVRAALAADYDGKSWWKKKWILRL